MPSSFDIRRAGLPSADILQPTLGAARSKAWECGRGRDRARSGEGHPLMRDYAKPDMLTACRESSCGRETRSDSGQLAMDIARLSVANARLFVDGSVLSVHNARLSTANCRLSMANSRLSTDIR